MFRQFTQFTLKISNFLFYKTFKFGELGCPNP